MRAVFAALRSPNPRAARLSVAGPAAAAVRRPGITLGKLRWACKEFGVRLTVEEARRMLAEAAADGVEPGSVAAATAGDPVVDEAAFIRMMRRSPWY